MNRLVLVLGLALAGPALAQLSAIEVTPLDEPAVTEQPLPPVDQPLTPDDTVPGFSDPQAQQPGFQDDVIVPVIEEERAETAKGGVVRVLDRVSGQLTDLEMVNGDHTTIGRISIALAECRYPADNPASDAYAYLTILNVGADLPVFEGWMIASSPALNALDHPRYDVWVMRCSNS
ncbi:DUF2155 domain-containing protein [Actibacterium sp.]|uniref:DUF2155 domain-containing protein n=1 Tax=Actibacterium sp. TaxID=1872125 RepID=UPI0035667DB9